MCVCGGGGRGGGGVLASRVIWDRVRETAMADTTSVTGKAGYIAHSCLLPSHPHAIFKHSVLFVFLLYPSDRTHRLTSKAALTSGLLLGRSEVLRSLRHYLSAQSPRTSHHRSPGGERCGKRKRKTIFLQRTRESHRQSDEHWNRFKGNFAKTSQETGLSAYGLFREH